MKVNLKVKMFFSICAAMLLSFGGYAASPEKSASDQKEIKTEKPLEPVIRADETIRGRRGAPIKIVEYSDFQCGFCARSDRTVKKLFDKYPGQIQFVFKHLPLDFHKYALLAAKYYEGLRVQDESLAFQFHDEIFKYDESGGFYPNQVTLRREGESYLKDLSASLGANMSLLERDVTSEKVASRIKEDRAEAASFGFRGTPAFVVNGVAVKGAYPVKHFEEIIARTTKKRMARR